MNEREKIKAALEKGNKAFSEYFRSELRKALDGGKGHYGTKDVDKTVIDFIADALIAANIGDVTEWKDRAEKEKAEKNKWKCTANDWKQRFESREKQLGELRTTSYDVVIRKDKVISEQKAEIARLTAEVAELRARLEKAEEVENKIQNGELVEAIWFKSWLNGQICCGRVIGYDDGGFVIESGGDLISAKKIYTSRERAEKEENKTDEDLPF